MDQYQVGLDILEADPSIRVIALISKPPGAKTLATLQERLSRSRKPVVGCLLGLEKHLDCDPNFYLVSTIRNMAAFDPGIQCL